MSPEELGRRLAGKPPQPPRFTAEDALAMLDRAIDRPAWGDWPASLVCEPGRITLVLTRPGVNAAGEPL